MVLFASNATLLDLQSHEYEKRHLFRHHSDGVHVRHYDVDESELPTRNNDVIQTSPKKSCDDRHVDWGPDDDCHDDSYPDDDVLWDLLLALSQMIQWLYRFLRRCYDQKSSSLRVADTN